MYTDSYSTCRTTAFTNTLEVPDEADLGGASMVADTASASAFCSLLFSFIHLLQLTQEESERTYKKGGINYLFSGNVRD